jgi:GNAT superfamily N-acetyltransferase
MAAMTTDYTIRAARPEDPPLLPAIEDEAGELFADIGMASVAGGQTTDEATHRRAQGEARLLVAAGADDQPVGFALLGEVDGLAHLFEISMHPAHGRRGIGSRLLEAAIGWARTRNYGAITLSTFRTVRWNGPWYARHGFRELATAALTPGLQELRRREQAAGLDVDQRCFMRLDLR